MTESSPATLLTPLTPNPEKTGSAGQLLPNTEARIVSVTDGSVLGAHKTGELQFRGPQVNRWFSFDNYYDSNVFFTDNARIFEQRRGY